MSSLSYSFRLNKQVPVGGRQNLKREKMFRYIDEDGIPFQGWYSTVQPSSFEKRWKLVCVCVSVCLSVVASGSRWWGLLSCLSYVQTTSTIRLMVDN